MMEILTAQLYVTSHEFIDSHPQDKKFVSWWIFALVFSHAHLQRTDVT